MAGHFIKPLLKPVVIFLPEQLLIVCMIVLKFHGFLDSVPMVVLVFRKTKRICCRSVAKPNSNFVGRGTTKKKFEYFSFSVSRHMHARFRMPAGQYDTCVTDSSL